MWRLGAGMPYTWHSLFVFFWCWLFPRMRGFGKNVRLFIPCLRFFSFSFFAVEISSRAVIPLFSPRSVHSGSASWDDCDRMFTDKLRVSSFPDRFSHYAWTAALSSHSVVFLHVCKVGWRAVSGWCGNADLVRVVGRWWLCEKLRVWRLKWRFHFPLRDLQSPSPFTVLLMFQLCSTRVLDACYRVSSICCMSLTAACYASCFACVYCTRYRCLSRCTFCIFYVLKLRVITGMYRTCHSCVLLCYTCELHVFQLCVITTECSTTRGRLGTMAVAAGVAAKMQWKVSMSVTTGTSVPPVHTQKAAVLVPFAYRSKHHPHDYFRCSQRPLIFFEFCFLRCSIVLSHFLPCLSCGILNGI